MTSGTRDLPQGLLVAWYGDDFTGSAAVMEVLTFAGLDSVLFLNVPTPERLARFPGARGIGIAGAARSKDPAWMEENLPPVFDELKRMQAPITHYKICSTFDSAPHVGSIGKAIELAQPYFPGPWFPLMPAAPPIGRWQAFGNLFAAGGEGISRLDRHATMSRHPATPMTESDVRVHLASQTRVPVGLVDLIAMKSGKAEAARDAELARGARVIALDIVDEETLRAAGALLWEQAGQHCLAVGSQGVEYALVAHWQAAGLLPQTPRPPAAARAERIAVVSGSCSPLTAEQIAWAEARGFEVIPVDVARAVDAADWAAETRRAAESAISILSQGRDPILCTARGPDGPETAAYRNALATSGADVLLTNQRIGEGLGRSLAHVLKKAKIRRAVVAGGDTSSHGASALGIYALTALAPTVPGAALCTAHSDDPALAGLELALKGGQMGTPDYFGRIRDGGSLHATGGT